MKHRLLMTAALCAAQMTTATEPVTVKLVTATHPALVAEPRADGSPRAMYHKPETVRTNNLSFPLVTLDNGRVEVKIVPTLGARVLNAVDRATGLSLAGTPDPRHWEQEPFKDILGFDGGYIEASFPYFEHGVGLRQSAGWRVLTNADASVTVAMNLRFTAHQEPRHTGRYGRYSPRQLSVWVTLAPGTNGFSATYRLDNFTPLRASQRLWVNHIFQSERYDEQHILYPAGYVIPHNGQTVAPFYAPGGVPAWVGISHFALYPDYGFSGIYRPEQRANSLIFQDLSEAPGLKLYTQNGAGGKMEIWCGTTPVFEDPGRFVAPYEPVQLSLTYELRAGERYWVATNGFADTRARLAEVKPLGGKFRLELEEISNHVGAPTDRDAIPAARKLLAAGTVADPEYALSLANVCYRYGHFDLVLALAERVGADPAADYLRGLVAWERGGAVDFGSAGLDAHYHRALLAVKAGDLPAAQRWLDELIAARPRVWAPRLLKAWLARDTELAARLAAENPASPEAQLVLEKLGVAGAAAAKAALLRDNPDALEQVAAFERSLERGEWTHPRRYAPMAPEAP